MPKRIYLQAERRRVPVSRISAARRCPCISHPFREGLDEGSLQKIEARQNRRDHI